MRDLATRTSAVPFVQQEPVASSRPSKYVQVRYVRVALENRELVPPVMRAFLGDCGLSHGHHAHATRACYLFMRIVKVLRPSLKGYLEELIQGLVPVIMAIAANPIQLSTGALKATQGKGGLTNWAKIVFYHNFTCRG